MGRKLIVMILAAVVGVGATPSAEAGKAKPKRGVFGTINGAGAATPPAAIVAR